MRKVLLDSILFLCFSRLSTAIECHFKKYESIASEPVYKDQYTKDVLWWTDAIAGKETCEGSICTVIFKDSGHPTRPIGVRECATADKAENPLIHFERIPPNEKATINGASCMSFKEVLNGQLQYLQTQCSCDTDECNNEKLANATLELHEKASPAAISKKSFESYVQCERAKLDYTDLMVNRTPETTEDCLGQWCLLEVYNQSDVKRGQLPHRAHLQCTSELGCDKLDNQCRYFNASVGRKDRPLIKQIGGADDGIGVVYCCCKEENCAKSFIPEAAALYKKEVASQYKKPVIQCPTNLFSFPADTGFWTQLKNIFVKNVPPASNKTCEGNWCFMEIYKADEYKFVEEWSCAYESMTGQSVCQNATNECKLNGTETTATCCCDQPGSDCITELRTDALSLLSVQFPLWQQILIFVCVGLTLLSLLLCCCCIVCCCCCGKRK